MTPVFRLLPGAALLPLVLALFGCLMPASGRAAPDERGGGISLGSTRVILNERDPGAGVRVINTSSLPFLIQSWVDSYRGQGGWEKNTTPAQGVFIVTPPLFRLDKGENSVLVRRSGGSLPADRESVFSLSVKAIPQTERPDPKSNYLQLAFVNSIKLFWRPAGLDGSPQEASRQLTFRLQGGRLEAVNPSAYHITLKTLKVGSATVADPDNRMIPPRGSQSWPLPAGATGPVTWTAINDYGGLTPPVTTSLK